ncbi:hypothetical protein ACER0A_011585 [Haloimpatiens sp. FM7315]|uniref:hypothetical protein n=1 Tax=Haloimpatiens sp. FM7315 TaxID=3298609 RepID=UPI003709DBF5
MEINKKGKGYGPSKRGNLEEKPKKVFSSLKKDSGKLPDNVTDPIISNNISNNEFDYTYNEGEDI